MAAMDCATEKNMTDLVNLGKNLLKEPVSRVNIDTGKYEIVNGEGTNMDALNNFAEMLIRERNQRKGINKH